ncbi:hypothetical protein AWC38_SpisGene14520 [Stylophora pistillata]|uniref:Integrase SAM-like N-terminal domain-containing protein n=1 Tax=Stylophora pistillata TaxID=50429 RepID=A0A2B4RVZ6_STYPI|nr:hypothetical protein AWC38_SpisGene14520 [Stylophora pistillata]
MTQIPNNVDLEFNCQVSTEDTDGLCRRLNDIPNMANPKLVPQTSSHVGGYSKSTTVTEDCPTNAGDETRSSPLNQENDSDCLQIVRQSYETQDFLELQSCRKGTTKQYFSYIERWTAYFHQKQIDPVSATVPQALEFLVEVFETGVGYSGIDTARRLDNNQLKDIPQELFSSNTLLWDM